MTDEPTREGVSPEIIDECCGISLSWIPFEEIDNHGRACSCPSCKKEYIVNGNTGAVYEKLAGAEGFVHRSCGTIVRAVQRVHSIWERGTTGGYGEVARELIPYCPKCEQVPETRGAPVFYKQPVIRDGAIDLAATDGWEK